MKIRAFLCLILLFCGVVFSQDYVRLSRKDKRDFIAAAKAVSVAFEEGNFAGVNRFGPNILKKYENIQLDPACKNLRSTYEKIETIIASVKQTEYVDSVEANIIKLIAEKEYLNAAKEYDIYFAMADSALDSLFKIKHLGRYNECVLGYFNVTGFESLKDLAVLKYVDTLLLDSLKKSVEVTYQDEFRNVSTSNSLDDLLMFKAKYPGLYEDDINNMIQNYKQKWRLSLKRKQSIERIEEYYRVFPEKDKFVDSILEALLYKKFQKDIDVLSAMKYLTYFPEGKYSSEIRTFIDVRDEQQRVKYQTGPYRFSDEEKQRLFSNSGN